jgi:hypothetical protein
MENPFIRTILGTNYGHLNEKFVAQMQHFTLNSSVSILSSFFNRGLQKELKILKAVFLGYKKICLNPRKYLNFKIDINHL